MPLPPNLSALSQVANSNSPQGTESVFPLNDDYQRVNASFMAMLRDRAHQHIPTATGTNTITGTTPSGYPTAYAAGQVFSFLSVGANTGAVTLNVNALGAKAVTKKGATALAANDILSGQLVIVMYDGTRFQMLAAGYVDTAALNAAITAATSTLESPYTGDLKPSFQKTDHGKWLLCDTRTLGNTGSGAALTGSQYQALFEFIWSSFDPLDISVTNSVGAPVARGASANADWIGNRRITLPNMNGLTFKGHHNGDGTLTTNTTRRFGSYEADDIKAHTHTYLATADGTTDGLDGGSFSSTSTGAVTGSAGGAETLVRNRSGAWFIHL